MGFQEIFEFLSILGFFRIFWIHWIFGIFRFPFRFLGFLGFILDLLDFWIHFQIIGTILFFGDKSLLRTVCAIQICQDFWIIFGIFRNLSGFFGIILGFPWDFGIFCRFLRSLGIHLNLGFLGLFWIFWNFVFFLDSSKKCMGGFFRMISPSTGHTLNPIQVSANVCGCVYFCSFLLNSTSKRGCVGCNSREPSPDTRLCLLVTWFTESSISLLSTVN